MMLGWLRAEAARASCSKRLRRAASPANSSGRTLIATERPSRVSRARKTSPMLPAPMRAVISYGPNFVPGATGIEGIVTPAAPRHRRRSTGGPPALRVHPRRFAAGSLHVLHVRPAECHWAIVLLACQLE